MEFVLSLKAVQKRTRTLGKGTNERPIQLYRMCSKGFTQEHPDPSRDLSVLSTTQEYLKANIQAVSELRWCLRRWWGCIGML